jgi:hypothetical protein
MGETSIRSQFQAVASRFYGASIEERIAAAEEMANLGDLLPFEGRARVRGFEGARRADRSPAPGGGPPRRLRHLAAGPCIGRFDGVRSRQQRARRAHVPRM